MAVHRAPHFERSSEMAVPKNTRPGAPRTVPIEPLWTTGTHVVFDNGQEFSSKAITDLLKDIPVIPHPPKRGAYKGLIEQFFSTHVLRYDGKGMKWPS
jgi:hypothetical protein